MPNQKKNRNYSIYDTMSTEMLEEILRADSQIPNSKDSDTDVILYIMEVIVKREKEHPTGKFTDIHIAWESFSKNYLPYLDEDKSLYDDKKDIIEKINQTQFFKPSSQKRRKLMRVACITAIVIVSLFVGNVTANALGFDLWRSVAKWTEDIFGFSVINNKQSLPDDLQETLDRYNINTEITPIWLPEGYLFESVDVVESPLRTIINSIYSNNNDEILVTIISLSDPSASIYEKDDNDVIKYSIDGVDHYIMTNLKRTTVVWMKNNYECSIIGNFSVEEAEKIIDSIYGR